MEPYIGLFGARQFFVGSFEELIEDESNMLSLIRWLDLDVSNTKITPDVVNKDKFVPKRSLFRTEIIIPPDMSTVNWLRSCFSEEAIQLENQFDINLLGQWGWR